MAFLLPWLSNSAGSVSLVQQSSAITQLFTGSSSWSPSNVALTGVASGNLFITLGGWWNSSAGNGGTNATPTDSNGTVSLAVNPTLPDGVTPPGWPVGGQIGYIAAPNSGTHTVTPPNIGGSGDGYFLLAEFSSASGSTWTLIDSGSTYNRSGTPGAIDGVTVTTTGSSAQAGDLIIALCVLDGDPTSVGIGSPTTGVWTDLLNTTVTPGTTATNIGMGAGFQLAASSGAQSATWAWSDNACEIGAGLIAVFRKS